MRSRFAFWTGSAAVGVVVLATAVVGVRGQDPGSAKYYPAQVTPPPPGVFPNSTVTQGGQPTTLPSSANPNVQYGSQPARPIVQTSGTNTPAPTGRPRITQAVVAGPEGVIPASFESGSPIPPPPLKLPSKSTTPPPTPIPDASAPNLGALPPPMIQVESAPDPKQNPPMVPAPKPFAAPTSTPTPKPLPFQPKPLPTSGVEVPPVKPPVETKSTFAPPPAMPVTPPPAVPSQVFPASSTPVVSQSVAKPQPLTMPSVSLGTPLPSKAMPAVTVEVLTPESISVGSPITFEYVVRNAGSTAVQNVRVEADQPGRTTLVGTEPAAEVAGERLAWNLGTIEGGAEKRVKATVKAADEGDLRSRATVTFATAADGQVKVTRPRVTVAVTGPESARVGDPVAFQIKLTNSGTGPAGKLVLRAEFTGGLAHSAGAVIEAELANLAAGSSRSLTLDTIAAKSGPQTCTITATADSNAPEAAKATVNLVEPLLIVKQTGPAKCLVRSEPVYAIELSNPGTAATDAITVWSTIPEGFEFVSATEGGTVATGNKTVSWRVPGLQPGTARVVTVKLRATAPSAGVVKTDAQAGADATGIVQTGTKPEAASKPLTAHAETVVKSEGVPALRFEVVDVEDPVEIGKEAVYEIRVANQGTGACTNVLVVADLPDGSAAMGATGPTTGRASGQQIAFDPIPVLAVKGDATFRVRVKGTLPGDQRFKVRVSCDQIRTPVVKEESTRFYKE